MLADEPPNLNPTGRTPLAINLNHAVWTVTTNPANPAHVTGSSASTCWPKATHPPGQGRGATEVELPGFL